MNWVSRLPDLLWFHRTEALAFQIAIVPDHVMGTLCPGFQITYIASSLMAWHEDMNDQLWLQQYEFYL